MAEIKHWRPQLFSALGAGFQNDAHVRDGIHLRWSSDPRLGLPIARKEDLNGLYRVYYLHDDFLCLSELDLFALKNSPIYPVHSNLNVNGPAGMDTAPDGNIRFYKEIDPDLSALMWQYFALTQWLQTSLLNKEEKGLLNYLNGIMEQIRPEFYDANWSYEIGEVCAVDALFKISGGDIGQYAWVRGYDRHGRLIAEDWVGRDKTGTKSTARLRSPHIYSIRIVPVKLMPAVTLQELCWMFCDEYSRAGIWRESTVERYFQIDESDYDETRIANFYYAPFQVSPDWTETKKLLLENLIQTSIVEKLPLQPDTYELSRYTVDLGTEDPTDQETFPNLELPVLASLIHAAADPAMANILGLYAWGESGFFPEHRDYKVEAYLPFFNEDNLISLRDKVLALMAAQGLPFTTLELEKLTGLPVGSETGDYHRSTSLCGLVLCPEISPKPSPYQPKPFTTHVTSLDLPSQTNENEADIYVNSQLRVTKPLFSTEPYLQPVAYEVERKLSQTDFENVIVSEDGQDPLDKIGILPSVYMPKDDLAASYWELRDDFRLPLVQQDTVQYRLTAFDIFGRPSNNHTGSIEPVPIPCHEPVAATSLTAQVERDQNDLNLELYFAVSGSIPPLHAVPQSLEMTIHPVNPLAAGPADEVTWSGSILGRTFTVNYQPDGTFLDETQLTPGCASLSWSGDQLIRTPLPPGDCDGDFPIDPTTLSLTQMASPILDEGDTGYRLYRLQAKIADAGALDPSIYRWCIRLRIQGLCESGATTFGRDVSTAAQYILLPPPPAVEQPPLVSIPESSYPDRQGDAYYNLDLSQFIPAAIANNNPMVNIYSVTLPQLTAAPEDVVDGDFFAPNGDVLVQTLGRAGRRYFQRVNEGPVTYTPDNRYYPIHVQGNLEEYHVVGVIGCNPQLDEKDWRQAGILLFKTPKPVPAPRFNFVSVRPAVVDDQVHVTLDYHADFETELPTGAPPPKVQIMRHDLSTGGVRFAGEGVGVWDAVAGGYHFQFTDTRAQQWRHYRYEASLLIHADKLGQIIKGEQTAVCKIVAPETGAASPFATGLAPSVDNANGELTLSFPFMAGDFNFSLTKALADHTTTRLEGQLYEGSVRGVPNASLTIQRGAGQYTLTYLDSDAQPGTYTLRLWQGQKAAWPQKLEVS